MKGSSGQGQRFVLMIDNSASMAATDVAPSRLAKAKEAAKKVVSEMDADDLAMVITFDDSAQVVSNYTGDRRTLLQRIDVDRADAVDDVAARGLAGGRRPGQSVQADRRRGGRLVGRHAQAVHLHRRRLRRRRGLQPGQPRARGRGDRPAAAALFAAARRDRRPADAKATARNPSDNVAILALQTRRDEDKPDVYQLFGRVHNFRAEEVATEAQLFRHAADKPGDEGTLVDAIALKLAPQSDQSFKFDLPDNGLDALRGAADGERRPRGRQSRLHRRRQRRARPRCWPSPTGNRYLTDTLKTPSAIEHADVTIVTPEEAKDEAVVRDLKGGRYDLVIYDGVKPESPPEANALYFGVFPPGPAYAKPKDVPQPVILDWDIAHPLMQYIRDLSLVYVAKASVVELPAGAKSLIDGNQGSLAFIVPREGYTDTVVTFPLMDGTTPNTTWFRYISFPLFILNSIQALGNVREGAGEEMAEPGRPVVLHAETAGANDHGQLGRRADGRDRLAIAPGNFRLQPGRQDRHLPGALGAQGPAPVRRQPVRLPRERPGPARARSRRRAREPGRSYKIKIGYNPVAGTQKPATVQKDIWWWLALLALGVLLVEWYIYNRRVYI